MDNRKVIISFNNQPDIETTMTETEILSMAKGLNETKVQTLASYDGSPWFIFKMSDVKLMRCVKEVTNDQQV